MAEVKQLKKRLDFKEYPSDWHVVRVAVDWVGEPLVLFEEGKPQRPPDADISALGAWIHYPPTGHSLIHWNNGTPVHTRFYNKTPSIMTNHIQPFGGGWLLGDCRGGLARIFDRKGEQVVRTLDLGDASGHVQTTPEGHIWVGYFDEGVFGNGMGASGLICFDSDGKPVFEYSGFADKHNLPDIDDCYALNVADDAVWICYYSAFPLICLKNFQAARVWHEFGDSSAVAVRGSQAVRFPAYRKPYLVARDLNDSTETIWNLTDQDGILLAKSAGEVHEEELRYRSPFSVAARGSKIYVHTENALFELP